MVFGEVARLLQGRRGERFHPAISVVMFEFAGSKSPETTGPRGCCNERGAGGDFETKTLPAFARQTSHEAAIGQPHAAVFGVRDAEHAAGSESRRRRFILDFVIPDGMQSALRTARPNPALAVFGDTAD